MSPATTIAVAVVLEAVPDGRVHGPMIGRRGDHPHAVAIEDDAVAHLGDRRPGSPPEIVVVGDAVADVVVEHREGAGDERIGADRPDDVEGVLDRRHHPSGGEHVVEVGDVVGMEMGEQHRREHPGERTGRGEAHQHAAAAVDEELHARRPERAWPVRPDPGGAAGSRFPATRRPRSTPELVALQVQLSWRAGDHRVNDAPSCVGLGHARVGPERPGFRAFRAVRNRRRGEKPNKNRAKSVSPRPRGCNIGASDHLPGGFV